MSGAILIVGGSSGIGAALVDQLEKEGLREIWVLDRKRPAAVPQRGGFEEIDMTDRLAVTRWITHARVDGRSFRSVVLCAAVHSTHPIETIPDEVIDRVMDVNFIAHAKFVRDILPLVEKGGSVIGVSSIGATVGIPFSSMYSASKGALELFYESLRTELSHRPVYPVLVQPGNVNTGFNETGNSYDPSGESFADVSYRKVVGAIESSRGMSPEKVAALIRQIISMPRPRLCYLVGLNARKAFWARRLLGRELAVRLMARFFGID